MGMSYRKVRKLPVQVNLPRCVILRQQYALEMIALLGSGKRIIQVDETWLNETNFDRSLWQPKNVVKSIG